MVVLDGQVESEDRHKRTFGDVRGVMVTDVGNRLGDTNSNPERDCLHFIYR